MNRFESRRANRVPCLWAGLLTLGWILLWPAAVTAEFPQPVPDDNGDYAFAREVTPILLGRKPRGALEVKLMGDVAALAGREALVRALMATNEFRSHWAELLLDVLRVQRGGLRNQKVSCFGDPLLADSTGTTIQSRRLAQQIRTRSPDTDQPPVNGEPFNMKDVALSSVALDDISVLMRTYLFPLAIRSGRNAQGEEGIKMTLGSDFTHVYLNRNLGCLTCHNEIDSVTGDSSGWNRAYPVEIGLDHVLLGASYGPGNVFDVYNLFRTDAGVQVDDNGNPAPGTLFPWGIIPDCITNPPNFNHTHRIGFQRPAASNNHTVSFAGLSGNDISVLDVEAQLKKGVNRLRVESLVLESAPNVPIPVPSDADAALAFTVAMSVVNQVWQQVIGRPLTIENYFPRNESQRDALRHLTEDVFLPKWSLRDLLAAILTSGYENRRAPDATLHGNAYQLPMIIDPWVARDPRQPDSGFEDPNDPKLSHNGQGELVRRHEPHTLLSMATAALDWPAPKTFGALPYPSAGLLKDLGQYWSQDEPGHHGFDLQLILAWEAVHAACEAPGGGQDWIDRALAAIDTFNAENPLQPLSIRDTVIMVKDWILQQATIDATSPQQGTASEVEAIAGLFSAPDGTPLPITTPVTTYTALTSAAVFESKLRQVCGVYLEAPEFMLKGISTRDPLLIPPVRACNDSACSYQAMCEPLADALSTTGHWIECLADEVIPGEEPPTAGPPGDYACVLQGDCVVNYVPECLLGAIVTAGRPGRVELEDCRPDIPRCDPRCSMGTRFGFEGGFGGGFGSRLLFPGEGELGLVCCGDGPGFDRFERDHLLGWVEGAVILTSQDAWIYRPESGDLVQAEKGEKLRFGDIVVLPPGARFEARGEHGRIELSETGVASIGDRTARPMDRELFKAVERSDDRQVAQLLKRGASPQVIGKEGLSVVAKAIELGNERLVRRLVDAGADINRRDARGNLPAEMAATLEGTRAANMKALLQQLGATGVGTKPRHRTEQPLLLMVTGPSAASAPHLAGTPYLSRVDQRKFIEARRKSFRPLSMDERVKRLHTQGVSGIPDARHQRLRMEHADNLLPPDAP